MKIQHPAIGRQTAILGATRKPATAGATPPSQTPSPAGAYTFPTADTENGLQKALSTAIGNYMEKLRRKPAAAPRQPDAMDSLHKDMLKARIDMLRKMMALAGNDPGSLRALAQQLSQAARELKSISGSTGGAVITPQASGTPVPTEEKQQEIAVEETDTADTSSEPVMTATIAAALDNPTQTTQQQGKQEEQSSQSGNNGQLQGKEPSKEEDPDIKKMLAELKQIRDWLKQQLRGSSDPQAKQALKDVDMALAAVEKNS